LCYFFSAFDFSWMFLVPCFSRSRKKACKTFKSLNYAELKFGVPKALKNGSRGGPSANLPSALSVPYV